MKSLNKNTDKSLDEREWEFLFRIVSEYTKKAEPVSSRQISKMDDVLISSATIRNVMMNLTEKGFLSQPHSSSGRIPSDKAYRLYVDYISDKNKNTKKNYKKTLYMLENSLSLEELIEDCLNFLAEGTKYASLATRPNPNFLKLKSIEFFKLSGSKILALLITDTGIIKNRIIRIRENLSQDFLKNIGERLTSIYAGKSIIDLQAKLLHTLSKDDFSIDDKMFIPTVRLMKKALDLDETNSIIFCGRTRVIDWMGVSSREELNQIYKEIEGGKKLSQVFEDQYELNKAYFKIGNEIKLDNLTNCALVAANYGANQSKIGSIGVIGPKRMDYKKIAELVENLSNVISFSFEEFEY